MTPLYVSITVYAQLHQVSRTTAYKWLDAGLLEFFRVEGVLRIRNVPPVHGRSSCQPPSSPAPQVIAH